MGDLRPIDCRFRLQDEGKGYPRSSCTACGKSISTGLGRQCSMTAPAQPVQGVEAVARIIDPDIWNNAVHPWKLGDDGVPMDVARDRARSKAREIIALLLPREAPAAVAEAVALTRDDRRLLDHALKASTERLYDLASPAPAPEAPAGPPFSASDFARRFKRDNFGASLDELLAALDAALATQADATKGNA